MTVVSTGKKLRRDVTTDREGRFVVPLLPPRALQRHDSTAGICDRGIKDLILNVLINAHPIHLKVARSANRVTLAGASLVQLSRAVVSTLVIVNSRELPLNGMTLTL